MAETYQPNEPDTVRKADTLWRYVPAQDYETPDQPASEKVISGLHAFWRRFWPGNAQASREEDDAECRPLSETVLSEVLPKLHWEAAASSLADQLSPWLDDDTPDLMRAVIGPPGSGVRQVVTHWGEQASATLLSPPDYRQMFDPEPDYWQKATHDTEGVLVIAELERFFLRHSDGLGLIRQLAEWLWLAPRRVVIGCDSWAWAYLCHAVHIDAVFRNPLALKPLDGDALRSWFRPRRRGRYLVRSARDGDVIYPIEVAEEIARGPTESHTGTEEPHYKGAYVFQRIAAMSRGIPEVALALWHKCLCEGDLEDGDEDELPIVGTRTPIRVRTPKSLILPTLPAGASTREAIVLHTLLLHAGLPASVLARLIPLPTSDVIAILSALREADLISEIDRVWKVAPLGYVNARAFVRAESLLIDQF